MKKFKFKLQRLLDIREVAEKEAKNDLARVLSVQNQERAKQEELRDGIDQNKAKFREKLLAGRFTAPEAMMFEKFITLSYRAIELAGERIKKMEPEVNRRRIKLIEASKERKIVDKLKERKIAAFNYDYNWEINKENDDANQKIYQKKMTANEEGIDGRHVQDYEQNQ